jgi:4-amino-4-deoxy-L-arabinose transferase-like glycosyltransferase
MRSKAWSIVSAHPELLAGLTLLLGLALRVHRIGDHNVWWDEGFSIYLARMPLLPMAVRTAADVHPPLHYAFLHYWDRLVGESEYALRYSSALFGLVDMALLFWLSRRYLGPIAALTATLLLAVNRLHVEWSQEMRMYTLATALVLLSTACFLRLTAERDRRARWWLGHLALSLAGLHTIYVFGLAPLCQSIAVLLGARRLGLSFVARWLAVQAAALALFLPWTLLFLAQPRARPVLIYPIDLLTWLRAVYTALPIGISAYLDSWTAVTLGATALFALPLARRRRGWLWLASYPPLLLSPLILYGLSYPNPILYAPNLSVRYVILFLPLYCALVAVGLGVVAERSRALGGAATLAALALCLLTTADLYGSRRPRDEYRSIASFIHSYAEPADAVVLYSDWDWPVFEYYFGTALPRYGVGTDRPQSAASAAGLGQSWLGRHGTLWLVTLNDAYDADPEGHLRRWLDAHTRVAADFRVDNKRLTLFTTDPGRGTARPAATGPRRALAPSALAPPPLGFDLPLHEIAAGESLHLATFWRGPGPAGARYHLELVGPDGAVLRRRADRLRPDWPAADWPPGATVRADHELTVPERARPGEYAIRLSVDDGTPARSAAPAEPVVLARPRVLPPERPVRPPLAPPQPPLPARDDRLGERLALVGAVAPAKLPGRGETLHVRVLWQAIQAMERPYTAFVQLLGTAVNPATGNHVWSQVDAPPDPALPTSDWLPGDLALVEWALTVPADLPGGSYELIAGAYDPVDGQRLHAADGRDFVRIAVYPEPS